MKDSKTGLRIHVALVLLLAFAMMGITILSPLKLSVWWHHALLGGVILMFASHAFAFGKISTLIRKDEKAQQTADEAWKRTEDEMEDLRSSCQEQTARANTLEEECKDLAVAIQYLLFAAQNIQDAHLGMSVNAIRQTVLNQEGWSALVAEEIRTLRAREEVHRHDLENLLRTIATHGMSERLILSLAESERLMGLGESVHAYLKEYLQGELSAAFAAAEHLQRAQTAIPDLLRALNTVAQSLRQSTVVVQAGEAKVDAYGKTTSFNEWAGDLRRGTVAFMILLAVLTQDDLPDVLQNLSAEAGRDVADTAHMRRILSGPDAPAWGEALLRQLNPPNAPDLHISDTVLEALSRGLNSGFDDKSGKPTGA